MVTRKEARRDARLKELAQILSARMDALRRDSDAGAHQQSFRAFADSIPAIIWTASATGELTYCNRQYYEFFGVDHFRWVELLHPDDQEAYVNSWIDAVTNAIPYESIGRFIGRDREYHRIVSRAQPIRNDSGQILYWIGSSAIVEKLVRATLQVA